MKQVTTTIQFDDTINHVWLPLDSKKKKVEPVENIYPIFDSTQAYNRLLAVIDSAQHTICISSFLLADTKLQQKLLDATSRRVRIYLMTSSNVHLKKIDQKEEWSDFDRESITHHIRMLDDFAGKILCRSAEHLHAKFILIDPIVNGKFSDTTTILLSTANFTSKALTKNPELMVEISRGTGYSREELIQFYHFFLQGFWNEADMELLQKGKWSGISGSHLDTLPIHLPSTHTGTTSLKTTILSMLSDDVDEMIVSSFSLGKDHETVEQLARLGEKVSILTRRKQGNIDALHTLLSHGCKIMVHGDMHAKFLVSRTGNSYQGLVFTANLTSLGLDTGYELGLEVQGATARALFGIATSWKDMMQEEFVPSLGREQLQSYIDQNIAIQDGLKYKQYHVVESEQDTQSQNSKDLSSYFAVQDDHQIVGLDTFSSRLVLTKEIVTTYQPPQLPKNAKKTDDEIELAGSKYPIFRHKKNKYIQISSEQEFQAYHQDIKEKGLITVLNVS